jgi:hypothetical protein
MNRREILAAIGAGGISIGSGCAGTIQHRLDRQPNRQFKLGWLSAANTDIRPHKIVLQVKENGNLVHESSHELKGQDREGSKGKTQFTVAECTWGNGADDYIIRARIDGNEWINKPINAVDTTGYPNVDCVIAQAIYQEGALEIILQASCVDVNIMSGGCSFAEE